MLAVDEHHHQIRDDSAVEADIELLGNLVIVADHGVEVFQALETDLHNLSLCVLDAKKDRVDDCLELLGFETEHTNLAVVDNAVDELEEADSEVRIVEEIILNNLKSGLT